MTATSAVIPFAGYGPMPAEASPVVINRTAEADAIVAHITRSGTRLVVLCGQAASGKTLLLRRWVIPALRSTSTPRGIQVFSAACGPAMPDQVMGADGLERLDGVLSQRSIVIIDDFDRVLDLPREERRQQLDAMFAKLSGAHRETILVIVVSVRHLTSIYGLSSYDPHIARAVYQVRSVGIDEGLRELCSESPETCATCGPEVFQALGVDAKVFERQGMEVTFELLRLLHARFARHRKETGQRTIGLAQYRKMGGLVGILRDYVNRQVDELAASQSGAHAVVRGILQRVLEWQFRLAPTDLDEIASRFDVPAESVRTLLDAMTRPTSLLRKRPDEVYEFLPPQIIAVVEEDVVTRQLQNERALRIIEEGLRSWQALRTYLPPDRFSEVHRQRRRLVLDEELTRFLAQCSLRFGDASSAEAARYWVVRLTSREDRIDILLFAAIDAEADVRERAVRLLASYPDSLVRERLSVLALTDPSAAVRGAAIDSLGTMADNALFERLLQEVQTVDGACRDNAVDALRIFPRPDVTVVLQSIVDDPKASLELRRRAVAVLAALNIPESVDALVTIALHDSDVADREGAANALATAQSVELNRRILEQLDWRRPTMRISATLVGLAVGLLLVVTYFFEVLVNRGAINEDALGVLVLGLVVLLAPLGALLTRIENGRLSSRSAAGAAALLLFWTSAVVVMPFVHGLAHALIRRWKHAFILLGLELLGLVALIFVADAAEFVPKWGGTVANIYRGVGLALIVGTYLYDVLAVALELFLFREAQATERRRSFIYRAVFRNPVMADATFGDLRSTAEAQVRRGQKLLQHFGSRIAPGTLLQMFVTADSLHEPHLVRALKRAKNDDVVSRLEVLWANVDGHRRRAIEAVLARKPTPGSIEALRRIAGPDGSWLKVRAAMAGLQFRLSVWSWPARIGGLCALPFMFVLLYHAMKVRNNSAWTLVVLLRQPLSDSTQKVKVVTFLAATYPGQSVDEVRALFQEGARRDVNAVQAALARGLVTIHDSLPSDTTYARREQLDADLKELRRELYAQTARFDTLLADSDPYRFAMGLDVLGAMAAAADSELSTRGIAPLVQFAAADSMSDERKQVLEALAGIRYTRALPALGQVLTKRQQDKRLAEIDKKWHITDFLQHKIDTVASRAYASIPQRTPQSGALLAMLEGLPYAPPSVIARIKRDAILPTAATPLCDRNHDRVCDDKDKALAYIASRPGSEQGYIDLFSHYGEQYQDAAAAFTTLQQEYSESIWPRRFLMFIYHEYLSADDPGAFEKSYRQMAEIQKLAAFRRIADDGGWSHVRFASDFVEVALTAGRYDEMERGARQLLALDTAETTETTRYNMTLFPYVASVMQHDVRTANARLDELEKLIRALPHDFDNNWIYPGTLAFIEGRSDLTPRIKQALVALCREGKWYPREQALEIVAQNRAALRDLATQTKP